MHARILSPNHAPSQTGHLGRLNTCSPTRRMVARAEGGKVNKGVGLLEWSGKLVPQGLLVAGRCSCINAWQHGHHRSTLACAVRTGYSVSAGHSITDATDHGMLLILLLLQQSSPLLPPQPGVKEGWRQAWQLMVRELAPQVGAVPSIQTSMQVMLQSC